jgi:hypothetical protein
MLKLISWITSAALLAAPWYAPKNLLAYSGDYLFILGIVLLCGLLSEHFLPGRVLKLFERALRHTETRKGALQLLLAAALIASLLFVNQFVLFQFLNSGDEHSCYFLAECLRAGQLWATPHPLSEFFDVTHVGNRDGKWFSVFPPGWPLLFALGQTFKVTSFINPLMAVLATLLFLKIGSKIFGFKSALLGMTLVVFSPFYLLNNASYYSHTTCFLMVALFIFAFLKWREKPDNVRWAAVAAVSVGYGLATRYLTMTAIAAPFIVYELVSVLTKRRLLNRTHFIFAGIFTLFIGLNLQYNRLITGNFLEFPNHFHHAWERLGFHSDHTFFDALAYVFSRFLFLSEWIAPMMIVIYFVALFQRRQGNGVTQLIKFGFFYLPLGYLFYYSWGGNQYGPRYYLEGLPFLALAAGNALQGWWSRGSAHVKKFILGLVLASLVGNFYALWKYGSFFQAASFERKALYNLAEQSLNRPSIVFIRGFLGDTLVLGQEDAVRNHPNLDSTILYAHDLGPQNETLMKYYPDRQSYIGSYDREMKKPLLKPISAP